MEGYASDGMNIGSWQGEGANGGKADEYSGWFSADAVAISIEAKAGSGDSVIRWTHHIYWTGCSFAATESNRALGVIGSTADIEEGNGLIFKFAFYFWEY